MNTRSLLFFSLLCLVASLKMPDGAATFHHGCDTIPRLMFNSSPMTIGPHVVYEQSGSRIYEDSTGNRIGYSRDGRMFIKGDTAKVLKGLFQFVEQLGARSCECEIDVKYYKKNKLVHTSGGNGNGWYIAGKPIRDAEYFIANGKKIRTDSILVIAYPK